VTARTRMPDMSSKGRFGGGGRRRLRGKLSFAGVQAWLLDEYVGLGYGHPGRYSNVIRNQLLEQVDFDARGLHSPDGDAPDLDRECARYERLVGGAGIGLQILGVGRNGHLAFNEPGSSMDSRTRVVCLAESTRADNARFFAHPQDVPRYAVTQGLATIGQAAHLLLLVTGPAKAEAIRAALEGPVTSAVPASAIRLHRRVTVLLDPPAAQFTRFALPG